MIRHPLALLACAPLSLPGCATAQSVAAIQSAPAAGYADLADLALVAPVVAEAVVRRVTRQRDALVPPGRARAYLEGDVTAAVRAPGPLGAQQGWVWEGPEDAVRSLKGARALLFARPLTGRPGLLQLVAPDAQQPSTPDRLATVRALVAEAARPDAAPAITGVTRAFFTPGALPGEGVTQLFVGTATGAPVSITVRRRPGEAASWSLALGDVVGAAAPAPERRTLTWYRLACGLPASLSADSLPDVAADADRVRRDYSFVLAGLGPCGRTRASPAG